MSEEEFVAKLIKGYLKDDEIDGDVRSALGRIVGFEISNVGENDRGLRQSVLEIVDGVARLIHSKKVN